MDFSFFIFVYGLVAVSIGAIIFTINPYDHLKTVWRLCPAVIIGAGWLPFLFLVLWLFILNCIRNEPLT